MAVEKAIRVKYGNEVNTNGYVEKIFDFSFSMPDNIDLREYLCDYFSNGSLFGGDASGNSIITQQMVNQHILFSTYNGTSLLERVRIQNDGNVGIGTSTPVYLLQQHKATASTANYHQITNNISGSTSADGLLLGLDASGNAVLNPQEPLPILFSTPGGIQPEKIRIQDDGNVGIGVSTPQAKLNVVNSVGNITGLFDNDFGDPDIGITAGLAFKNGTDIKWHGVSGNCDVKNIGYCPYEEEMAEDEVVNTALGGAFHAAG